jgi:hypothetical protein
MVKSGLIRISVIPCLGVLTSGNIQNQITKAFQREWEEGSRFLDVKSGFILIND